MTKKSHYLIDRLPDFRRVYNAIFHRTATVEHALPKLNESIANIIRDASIIQAGLGHITEAYSDSQPLSDKFAHLVTFAINLPTTIEGDGSFWGYALGLVDMETFKQGAEYCDIGRLHHFIEALQKVIAIKLSIEADADDLPAQWIDKNL